MNYNCFFVTRKNTTPSLILKHQIRMRLDDYWNSVTTIELSWTRSQIVARACRHNRSTTRVPAEPADVDHLLKCPGSVVYHVTNGPLEIPQSKRHRENQKNQ